MSGATRVVIVAAVAVVVMAGAYIWRAPSQRLLEPTFGPVITNAAVGADVSKPLSTLSPPDRDDPGSADRNGEADEARSNASIRMKVSRASADIEQLAPGTKPAATLAV